MGAAINNMNREIKHIIEEFEVEASQANKFYSKWSDQRDEKVNHVVES
jgi:archaellum component FlaC